MSQHDCPRLSVGVAASEDHLGFIAVCMGKMLQNHFRSDFCALRKVKERNLESGKSTGCRSRAVRIKHPALT